MGYLDLVTVADVNDPGLTFVQHCDLLTRYICQTTGTPWATGKDIAMLRKKCRTFFERYPHLDYATLCHVADWCQRRKRRYSNVWKVIDAFRYAYEDGALPEVDRLPVDRQIEDEINEALEVETDPNWVMTLAGTTGAQRQKEVLKAWQQNRKPMLVPS